ncbi:proline-rich antigen [Moniliophthora roreri]|nr:proline-rich antigen [Moniliophthora roreri]
MLAKFFALFALVAVAANAQSACVLQCAEESLPAGGCSSVTDFGCMCNSDAFQQAAKQCLEQKCTPEDQQAGADLIAQNCAN